MLITLTWTQGSMRLGGEWWLDMYYSSEEREKGDASWVAHTTTNIRNLCKSNKKAETLAGKFGFAFFFFSTHPTRLSRFSFLQSSSFSLIHYGWTTYPQHQSRWSGCTRTCLHLLYHWLKCKTTYKNIHCKALFLSFPPPLVIEWSSLKLMGVILTIERAFTIATSWNGVATLSSSFTRYVFESLCFHDVKWWQAHSLSLLPFMILSCDVMCI